MQIVYIALKAVLKNQIAIMWCLSDIAWHLHAASFDSDLEKAASKVNGRIRATDGTLSDLNWG